MIRIKVVLFRHSAVYNIFMIFWEGIRLFSVLYQLHQVLINTALAGGVRATTAKVFGRN